MSYCIRSARPDEAAAVADLAVETFPMACPPSLSAHDMHAYIDEHLTAQRFAEHIAHPERDVLVASDDTHLLGYVLLFFGPDGAPAPDMGVTLATSGLLSKCYVRREGHGQGVAAALLEAAASRWGAGRRRALAQCELRQPSRPAVLCQARVGAHRVRRLYRRRCGASRPGLSKAGCGQHSLSYTFLTSATW